MIVTAGKKAVFASIPWANTLGIQSNAPPVHNCPRFRSARPYVHAIVSLRLSVGGLERVRDITTDWKYKMEPITLASYIAAFCLAATRLLTRLRPMWDHKLFVWIPEKLEPVLPAMLAALPIAAEKMTGVKSGLDLADSILMIVVMFALSIKGQPERE